MLVTNWMTKKVVTAGKYDSIEVAKNLLKQYGISLLPVMEGKLLCGVISNGDLYGITNCLIADQADPDFKHPILHKTVEQVMTPNVITVSADFTVEETIELLLENGLHGAPVIDVNQNLIGIVTKTDLLKAVVDLTGASRRGIQYAFVVEDCPGVIKELSDTIRSHGGRISSILTSCEGVDKGYRKAYIRMYGIDRFRLRGLNEALKQSATLVSVVDHVEIRKEENTAASGNSGSPDKVRRSNEVQNEFQKHHF
ncbi:MAG: CBS and ACT domain-containing protein [Desulfobacterales bacterium]|jgi:acetoin utilization protein AcuB